MQRQQKPHPSELTPLRSADIRYDEIAASGGVLELTAANAGIGYLRLKTCAYRLTDT